MGDASWLGAAGGGGPMAAAAADAEERAKRFVGLLPGGGGRPLFVDILQWELGLDQKRKVVVRGQERSGVESDRGLTSAQFCMMCNDEHLCSCIACTR